MKVKMSDYNHLQIDWRSINTTEVSKDTWNTLKRYWEKNGTKFSAARTINRTSKWAKFGTYRIIKTKEFVMLQVNDNGDLKQYSCNLKPNSKKTADNKEGKPGEGTRALKALKEELKKLCPELRPARGNYNPLKYAFGEVPKMYFPKTHVPSPISFVNRKFVGQILSGVYKADISSAYPAAASETLPNAHAYKLIPEVVEPTEEYPFCFYSNGHIAIFNELDSRKWPELDYGVYAHSQRKRECLNNKIEYTIVMQASKYSLRPIFEEGYKNKEESFGDNEKIEYYKGLMNKAIGCFMSEEHYSTTRNYPNYAAHLSAVIIARIVNRMLTECYNIRKAGGEVIAVYTDCVMWRGIGNRGLTREKQLGKLVLEAEDEYCTVGGGVGYALQRKGESKAYKIKASGYSKEKRDKWGKPLETLEVIAEFFLHTKEYYYQWNEQTQIFDKIEKESSHGRKKMGKMVQSVSRRIDF